VSIRALGLTLGLVQMIDTIPHSLLMYINVILYAKGPHYSTWRGATPYVMLAYSLKSC
jgi:hypothetical protein